MKQIQYTGSSKLISRIVHLLNRKAPLPLNGDGDAVWGTNGQVLTTDGNGNTSWTTPQGGGGDVTDVEVNGTSVVNAQGVAEVSVPTATSDLNNDSGFIDGTDLSTALSDYTPTANLATVATSGDYDDLINKPSIPAAQVNSDWDAVSGVAQILNKPSLATVATSGSYNDLSDKPTIPAAQVQSDWSQADNTQPDFIKNKPTIPTALADLSEDTTHRVVTDTEKSTWNGKSDFSGSYNDLTDKPTIPTVNDGTLTIQQNGTTLGTFSANQSGNTTVNLTGGGGSTYTEGDGIDISSQNVISVDTAFTEASTRTNIASGDSFSTILGKIKKFFTDLKTVAFSGKSSDLNNDAGFITADGATSVKDYNNNMPTMFGYSTSGMAQSDATWLGAWDASGGAYRLRAVKQSTLKVAEATKASQDGSGNTITSTYIPYVFSYKNYAYVDGSHQWFRMAILTVTDSYINQPITFEVSSRGRGRISHICVMFSSASGTDPGLSSITTDFDGNWFIKKTATSTWELYVNTGGVWNPAYFHRCYGAPIGNGVNVSISITALSSAPTGTTQASYGGNVDYATSAGKLTYASQANFLSIVAGSGYSTSNDYSEFMRYGNIVHARFNLKMSSQQATRTSRSALGGVSAQFKPSVDTASVAQIFCGSTYVNAAFVFLSNGSIRVDTFDVAIPANTWMDVICIYGLRS